MGFLWDWILGQFSPFAFKAGFRVSKKSANVFPSLSFHSSFCPGFTTLIVVPGICCSGSRRPADGVVSLFSEFSSSGSREGFGLDGRFMVRFQYLGSWMVGIEPEPM